MESLFLKGNAPDASRALWVKYTLLVPHSGPALAELWAVAFERGRAPCANKRSYPIARAQIRTAPFGLTLPDGELTHGAARGALGFDAEGGPRLSWDLQYACPEEPFRPFPTERMYTGRFPRTKTLTPAPDTRLTGFFEVDGERWDVTGYPAAQGHNWGLGHAHAYAWAHVNDLHDTSGRAHGAAWLEAISGRVRIGPVTTPFLSCAAIALGDRLLRFDGPRALLSRSVRVDARSYAFSLRNEGATLHAQFRADTPQIAGLRYTDPDGASLSCLNSKLAEAEITLALGKERYHFQSRIAALEIGTRAADHGVALLV